MTPEEIEHADRQRLQNEVRANDYIERRAAIGDPMSEFEKLHWRLCQLNGIDWPVRGYNHRGWLRYRKPLQPFQMRLVKGLKKYEE